MSRTNGRPEPEVIVNFSDGFAYSKGKMEDAFRSGGLLENAYKAPAPAKIAAADKDKVKKEDVELIMNELEITKIQAEKALIENGGDVLKTLKYLITPKSFPTN